MERPRRYCTNCGSQVSTDDAFCGTCGKRLSPAPEDTTAHRADPPQAQPERISSRNLPAFPHIPAPGRDSLLGALLALGCAAFSIFVLYVLLAVRGDFPDASVPATAGLALFTLIHGGGVTLDVPPTPSLLGIGGSLRLGLPLTSFALLPFLASLLGTRFLAQRAPFLNADKANTCTEVGPYEEYGRGPYSGKLQAWYGCGDDGATVYALAAYPEGRGCVIALSARVSNEADREAVEHLLNTVEADCSRVTSDVFSDPSASASASASPVASAETPAGSESGAQGAGCSDPAYAAQNPGECGTTGYNPVLDPGDNYSQGVVVGDDTLDCARPEEVLESGLCAS